MSENSMESSRWIELDSHEQMEFMANLDDRLTAPEDTDSLTGKHQNEY